MKTLFNTPLTDIYAWTDSKIILRCLVGSPRRFKTFVGNWVPAIVDRIPHDRWNHVISAQTPADCASRGVFPTKLICHDLWWNGPIWLQFLWDGPSKMSKTLMEELPNEEREVCLALLAHTMEPILSRRSILRLHLPQEGHCMVSKTHQQLSRSRSRSRSRV